MSELASPARRTPGRNPGIDLLRGLSIVLVVLHHLGLRIPLRKTLLAAVAPRWLLDALIYNGSEAVFVFFVISGFLITHHALERWGGLATISLHGFYARRASRILPLLLILIALLSALHLLGVSEYVIARPGQSLPRAIAAALGLHLNWYEGRTGYLPGGWDVLWSLSIEEVFYLGFPLVCLALARSRLLVAGLVLLACSLPLTRAALQGNAIWQEKAYLPGMAGIATGVLAALVAEQLRARLSPRWLFGLQLVGALGLLWVLCWEGVLWKWLGNGALLVLTGSTALLLLGFHLRPRTLPGTGWLRSMGRLSYEIYLSHMFVVFGLLRVFRATGADLRWGFLWFVPLVALSWRLGWAIERLISRPLGAALRAHWLEREPA